jgi:hypothetical protein
MEGLLRGERGHATAAKLIGLRATPRRVVWPTRARTRFRPSRPEVQRWFFYMPFHDSENLTDHAALSRCSLLCREKPDRRGPLRR